MPALREGADTGRPIVAVDPDERGRRGPSPTIAERIDVELAPTRRYNPGLKLTRLTRTPAASAADRWQARPREPRQASHG